MVHVILVEEALVRTLLMDLDLPHVDGLSLLEDLRRRSISAPILVLTVSERPHLRATVRSTGANELVRKPYDQEELIAHMRLLLAA